MRIIPIGWWGGFPNKNEATAGYLLQTKHQNILIDCGSGVLSRLQNHIGIEQLNGVLLSHYHADHMSDIYVLQYAMRVMMDLEKRKEPLYIYGTDEDSTYKTLTYKKYAMFKKIDEKTDLNIGKLNITFHQTNHSVSCFAMKIKEDEKTLVYSADTGWDKDLVSFCKDADVLICETSLYNELKGRVTGHLTAGEVGKLGKSANVSKILLTHLPSFGDLKRLLSQVKDEYEGDVDYIYSQKMWDL